MEAATFVMTKVEEGLGGVEKQPENTEKYGGLDKGPATYGVVKQLRDNDMDLHSDQQVTPSFLLKKKEEKKRGGFSFLKLSDFPKKKKKKIRFV